jgi:hypothetical protein
MQQEMDFGVFDTGSCKHAHRKNTPPQPDADGLFDVDGVSLICGRPSVISRPSAICSERSSSRKRKSS